MAHQKFQNVDLQKFQYNEEVTAVHLGAIIKHILICTTTVINIFYQKAFLSQVDINIVLLAHIMLRKILFQHKKSMVHLTY